MEIVLGKISADWLGMLVIVGIIGCIWICIWKQTD